MNSFNQLRLTAPSPDGERVATALSAVIKTSRGCRVKMPGRQRHREKLAQGIADLVQTNGKEITSVLYYPPA